MNNISNQKSKITNDDRDDIFQKRLINATEGLQDGYKNSILNLTHDNAALIVNFINSYNEYENLAPNTRKSKIAALTRFMKFLVKKYKHEISFRDVQREDFTDFQDSLKKSPTVDPLHKWIGSYNQYLRNVKTFYKWINNPELPQKDRKNPPYLEGINQMHRREITTYSENDMWSEEDDSIFLKYCQDPRIRCYHMMARDTSGRPHELLVKRIGDFKEKVAPNGVKYMITSIGAGGKTKQRPVSLYKSYPHYLEWLNHHPTPTDPTSFVFRSYQVASKYNNVHITTHGLDSIYMKLKTEVFPKQLNRDIPEKDKIVIKSLLLKPWNPYVRRHTSLTEKVSKINEWNMKQHAGWTKDSKMINRYTHELGNTSNDAILNSCFGIETKNDIISTKLNPVQCVCGYSNRHDASYCSECKRLLSFEGYNAIIEENKNEKERIESLVESAKKETEQKFVKVLNNMDLRIRANENNNRLIRICEIMISSQKINRSGKKIAFWKIPRHTNMVGGIEGMIKTLKDAIQIRNEQFEQSQDDQDTNKIQDDIKTYENWIKVLK